MKTNYTQVWEINNRLVVAKEVEDAITLYKKSYDELTGYCPTIRSVKLVTGGDDSELAILSVYDNKNDKEEKV